MPKPPVDATTPSLTIQYKNTRPLEVGDFADSLYAVANEYKRFVENKAGDATDAPEFRLFVKEMREGSIIAVLEALPSFHDMAVTAGVGLVALPSISQVNDIYDFAGHLKVTFDYLLHSVGKKPELNKASLDNVNSIVEPTAKDQGSQLIINVTGNNNVLVLNASSLDTNAVQNAAKRELKSLALPAQQSYERVILTWYQVRKDSSDKGDRAIIESVSERPYKCVFQNETVKAAILADAENLFKFAYFVDVMVERIRGKIICYKIMGLYDKIPLDVDRINVDGTNVDE